MGNKVESMSPQERLVRNHRDITNPLLIGVKEAGREIFESTAAQYSENGVTVFDTAIQTMMHLASYQPPDVWQPCGELDTVVGLFNEGQFSQGSKVFTDALKSGRMQLNKNLVSATAAQQARKLVNHYASAPVVDTFHGEMNLASYLYNPENTPFIAPPDGAQRNRVIMQGATEYVHPITGERILQAHEEYSGVPINLQRITEETAELIGNSFHYLHAYRPGVVSYGAFVAGDPYPFAMASFDNVNRGYKEEMLQHFGIDPKSTMELTRGWNGGWSPEGTMSVLFGHAHRELKRTGSRHREGQKVNAVLTAINPNLFGGYAFRAANFVTIGHKPAGFTYMKEECGDVIYAPRWMIEERLGVDRVALKDHPQYCENGMPLFPTNEMLHLFDPNAQKALGNKAIYEMDAQSYNSK
jgi:hypothetical protein